MLFNEDQTQCLSTISLQVLSVQVKIFDVFINKLNKLIIFQEGYKFMSLNEESILDRFKQTIIPIIFYVIKYIEDIEDLETLFLKDRNECETNT